VGAPSIAGRFERLPDAVKVDSAGVAGMVSVPAGAVDVAS
jgi:hypothetical protein